MNAAILLGSFLVLGCVAQYVTQKANIPEEPIYGPGLSYKREIRHIMDIIFLLILHMFLTLSDIFMFYIQNCKMEAAEDICIPQNGHNKWGVFMQQTEGRL